MKNEILNYDKCLEFSRKWTRGPTRAENIMLGL